jgi:hypothetical protein
MYAYSATIAVNPAGEEIELTQDQVWRGLMMKAEYAIPFVPGMTVCDILERYDDGFLREVVIRGERMKERITFTPSVEVYFERVNSPANAGWITNVVSQSDMGLMLTFTFSVRFPGVETDSPAEQELGDRMRANYRAAVAATLRQIRALVRDGKLGTRD